MMASRDPTYAKIFMPILDQPNDVAAADDLSQLLQKLYSHNATQPMNAVATLSADTATKSPKEGAPPPKVIPTGIRRPF